MWLCSDLSFHSNRENVALRYCTTAQTYGFYFFFHLAWSLNSYLITSRCNHLCTSTSTLIPARLDFYQSASAGKVGMFCSV